MGRKKRKTAKDVAEKMFSSYDVLGSWTGSYLLGELDYPEQDVDDL